MSTGFIIFLLLLFGVPPLCTSGFRRFREIDARARAVSRNKVFHRIDASTLPTRLRSLIRPFEKELSDRGFNHLVSYANDFYVPNHRGSFASIYISADNETTVAFSLIVAPRIIFFPFYILGYPFIIPFYGITGQRMTYLSFETRFEDHSRAISMNGDFQPDWYPPDLSMQNIEIKPPLQALYEKHSALVRKHIAKTGERVRTLDSAEEYFAKELEFNARLNEFGDRLTEKMFACGTEPCEPPSERPRDEDEERPAL